MPEYVIEAIIEADAPNEFAAKARAMSLFDKSKVNSLVVHNVVAKRTPYDVYADAKAAFYAAGQCDGEHKKEAEAYIDAAIKALHHRQLDTTQLMSVWQDVKFYL